MAFCLTFRMRQYMVTYRIRSCGKQIYTMGLLIMPWKHVKKKKKKKEDKPQGGSNFVCILYIMY